jgi:predicted nucleic acid-binding protein
MGAAIPDDRLPIVEDDSVYVDLAEALDTVLLTCDARRARTPGMARRVELIQ